MANSAFDHSPSITVPGSSTNTALVRWNGTGGKTFLDSTILVGATTMGLAADTDLLTFGNGTIAITGAITGVTTITATTFSGALSGNASGSAATLTNARTIGGVSFNGSANINLPGVNSAGNQNTSGTAAGLSATLVVASGGTNTTSYTKGDVLIASAGTTLTKLGIGTDDYVLTADASEATGVKWAAAAGGANTALSNLSSVSVNADINMNSQAIENLNNTESDLLAGVWTNAHTGTTQMNITRYTAGANGPAIYLQHSRNASLGGQTAVANNDELGIIELRGSNGTSFVTGAYIVAHAQETWSSSARGCRMQFFTTPLTTTGNTEQFRIIPSGGIRFYNLEAEGGSTDVNLSGGATLHTVTSSRRFKIDERPLSFDCSILQEFEVKEYTWGPNSGTPGREDFGLIAEDVYALFPQCVNLLGEKVNVLDDEGRGHVEYRGTPTPYSFRTQPLLFLAIAEIQRLNGRIEALERNN